MRNNFRTRESADRNGVRNLPCSWTRRSTASLTAFPKRKAKGAATGFPSFPITWSDSRRLALPDPGTRASCSDRSVRSSSRGSGRSGLRRRRLEPVYRVRICPRVRLFWNESFIPTPGLHWGLCPSPCYANPACPGGGATTVGRYCLSTPSPSGRGLG